ncbi:MAG TPA: DUF2182 domain-containing protein [Vicinamibacterales bacterium]|nr:DUF2182 domain-containing protein [Vicinamibacterales bacterium]
MDGRLSLGRRVLVPYAAAGIATLAAWLWLAGAASVAPHVHTVEPAAFGLAVVMWQAMIVAMMAPVVAPWVAAYARLLAPEGGGATARRTASFAGGYFLVWLAYSVAAAALQLALQQLGALTVGVVARPLAAAVLICAGAAQFLPLKRACLTHCRNPLSYLIARWRNGPPSGLRLGAVHGAYCLGCCWLLMLTGLAMGVMNLAWMAVLTVIMVIEQTAPGGPWIGRAFGVVLLGWGVARLLAPV